MIGLGACAGAPSGQAAETEDPRCAVALAFARTIVENPGVENPGVENPGGRTFVFTAEDIDFGAPLDMTRWMGADKPDPALLARLQAQGNQGAVQRCASLRALLDSKGIAHGAEATQAVVKASDGTGYAKSIETVSMPVLSADGQSALIASSSVAGPMNASGTLHMMKKRSDGKWETVSSAPLWMS